MFDRILFTVTSTKTCSAELTRLNECSKLMIGGKFLNHLCAAGIKSTTGGAMIQSKKSQLVKAKANSEEAKGAKRG
jgi:hypothetical protein